MNAPKPRAPFVLRMPETLRDQIEQMAHDEQRTPSAMARILIEAGLANREAASALRPKVAAREVAARRRVKA